MLETQFYLRLVITALFGVLFIYAMINLSKSNAIPDINSKHLGKKIFGSVFLLISVVSGIGSIFYLCNMTFPEEMIGQPLSANMIVRKVDAVQYWGYPTTEQQFSISLLTSSFAFLAFAGYFFCFRKSHNNRLKRIFKVILIILTYMFYVSSTDWHYFDTPEFIATILYAICIGIIFRISKAKNATHFETEQPHINNEYDVPCKSNDTSEEPVLLTQQTDDALTNNLEDAREPLTYNVSSNTIKNVIISIFSSIGNFCKRIFGSIKFRVIGIIVACILLLIGGVVIFVSAKSYPHYTESFGDKWKSTFNISNESLVWSLMRKVHDEKSDNSFLITDDYKGRMSICDSRYFYKYISEIEQDKCKVWELSKPFKNPDPEDINYKKLKITEYDAISYYDIEQKLLLLHLFEEQGVEFTRYSINDYKNRCESWMDMAATIYTNNISQTVNIADYYIRNQNYNKAKDAYAFAISHDKNNSYLLGRLSLVELKCNNIYDAALSAEKAINLDHTNADAATSLAIVAEHNSDWGQALKWSKVAIDYGTELPEAYYVYSASQYNLGNKDIAAEFYNKAHDLDSENFYAKKYEECGGCPIECINIEHGFTANGKIITDFGKKLHHSKSTYIETRMHAIALRTGKYTIDIKLYQNGKLSTGDSRASEGYTYSTTIYIFETGKDIFNLGGWGNDTPGCWRAGNYRLEVWYKGELVEESRFKIE